MVRFGQSPSDPGESPPPAGWAGICTLTLRDFSLDPAHQRPLRLDRHLLILVTVGHGAQEVDFRSYPCRPGSLIWVQPGQVVDHGGQAGLDAIMVSWAPEAMLGLGVTPVVPPFGAGFWQLAGEDEDAVISEVSQLVVDCQRHRGDSLATDLLRHQLAVLLLRLALLPGTPAPNSPTPPAPAPTGDRPAGTPQTGSLPTGSPLAGVPILPPLAGTPPAGPVPATGPLERIGAFLRSGTAPTTGAAPSTMAASADTMLTGSASTAPPPAGMPSIGTSPTTSVPTGAPTGTTNGSAPVHTDPVGSGSRDAAGTFWRLRYEVERSYGQTRRVEDYAGRLRCSVRTLTRACLAATGRSAKQVIDDRVALEARRLLATTDLPVADVGRRLGFSEPTNFGRFFQREVGQSPGVFRAGLVGRSPGSRV